MGKPNLVMETGIVQRSCVHVAKRKRRVADVSGASNLLLIRLSTTVGLLHIHLCLCASTLNLFPSICCPVVFRSLAPRA